MLAFICAMQEEAEGIIKRMSDVMVESNERGGYAQYRGSLCGRCAVVHVCQPGKVNAAVCASEICLNRRQCSAAIVNIGLCGATTNELHIGDVCIVSEFIQHDIDTTALGDEPGMISGMNVVRLESLDFSIGTEAALFCAGVNVRPERPWIIATGDVFLGKLSQKESVLEQYGAELCDMEAAAIAQVCWRYGVQFASVKVVSDTPADDASCQYIQFKAKAKETIGKIAEAIAAYACL